MHQPNALVLEVSKQDNKLSMSLFEHRDLASTLRHYSESSFSLAEIERLCQEAALILGGADKKSRSVPNLIDELKKTGQLLWDHLLTKSVKSRLRDSQVKDLILSIDEELINIPWELLYDGNNFLCLDFNLGRLVRTKEEPAGIRYRSFSSVLKMLILANPTDDLKSAYLEGLDIKNQFDRKRNSVLIDFKSTHIDKLYVKKNLSDYDIVHFAGHCEYDQDKPENTGWVLSDGRFTTAEILAVGSTVSLPALVFSNACYSAKPLDRTLFEDYREKNYSLASAFLHSGVRHYIGSIRRIEDPVSLAFAREFYTQLISGRPVGECVRLSRLSLIKEYGIAASCWADYLLYGDPGFVLFAGQAKPKPAQVKRDPSFYKKVLSRVALALIVLSMGVCLYMWLPTLNPSVYFQFSRSRKLFQAGRNHEVISLCNQIIKKDPLFLAAYPLLAQTYQRTGDRENAIKNYFDYAISSEKKRDKRHLASAYTEIGWLYQAQGEFQKAYDFYNKAVDLSRENKDKLNEAVALRKLAVWYIDKADFDKALQLLTKSSEINRQKQHNYEHRYNLACDYFDIGLVFVNKDDFPAAKDFYVKSKNLFESLKLKNELSDYYFNLGEIYLFDKEYQKALDSYLRGLRIDQGQGNVLSIASDYNMIGELFISMDNLFEAEKYFKQAAEVYKKIESPLEYASVCYNLGLLYKNKGQRNKAREFLRQAQEIYARLERPEYQVIKEDLLSLEE